MAEAVWKLICPLSESLAQDCTRPDTCSMLIGQAKRGRVLVSTQRDSVAACGLSRASSGCYRVSTACVLQPSTTCSLCAADQVAPGRRQQARPIGPVGVGLVVFASSGPSHHGRIHRSTIVSRPLSDRIAEHWANEMPSPHCADGISVRTGASGG